MPQAGFVILYKIALTGSSLGVGPAYVQSNPSRSARPRILPLNIHYFRSSTFSLRRVQRAKSRTIKLQQEAGTKADAACYYTRMGRIVPDTFKCWFSLLICGLAPE